MQYLDLIIEPDIDEPDAAHIFVDGVVNDEPYRFLLDTGAGRSHIESNSSTLALETAGQDSSSGVFVVVDDDLVIVSSVKIGPLERSNFPMVRSSQDAFHTKNLIGMDILKDHRCSFAFRERRLYIDREHESTSIFPLRLDQKFHPYTAVQLASGNASAVWDTGASLTIVDTEFIERYPANFIPAGTSVGTDATGASQKTPMFRMSEVIIGERTFPGCRVASVDLAPINAKLEMKMDMILGYNIFGQVDWLFDFPNGRWGIL